MVTSFQGRRENSRGPGQNYTWDPCDVIIFKQERLKTGGPVLPSVENTFKQGP